MDNNGGRSDGVAEVTCSSSNAVGSACPSSFAKLVLLDCKSTAKQMFLLSCFSMERDKSSPSLIIENCMQCECSVDLVARVQCPIKVS